MVDRDGLENRYPGNGIGGSNPSPSARKIVNFYVKLGIWVAAIAVVFGFLWHKGQLLRLSNYIQETREELKKCTWPSWEELKGSTLVVMISILILGLFTVVVDFAILKFVNWII